MCPKFTIVSSNYRLSRLLLVVKIEQYRLLTREISAKLVNCPSLVCVCVCVLYVSLFPPMVNTVVYGSSCDVTQCCIYTEDTAVT